MDNPILQMLTGGSQNQNPLAKIVMQAIGAMLRGESPQAFLQNLAKNNPMLNGYDLSDPEKAAEQLYKDKGQDISAAKETIMEKVSAFMSKK